MIKMSHCLLQNANSGAREAAGTRSAWPRGGPPLLPSTGSGPRAALRRQRGLSTHRHRREPRCPGGCSTTSLGALTPSSAAPTGGRDPPSGLPLPGRDTPSVPLCNAEVASFPDHTRAKRWEPGRGTHTQQVGRLGTEPGSLKDPASDAAPGFPPSPTRLVPTSRPDLDCLRAGPGPPSRGSCSHPLLPQGHTIPRPCLAGVRAGREPGGGVAQGASCWIHVPGTALAGLQCHPLQVTCGASIFSGVKGGGELADSALVLSADLAWAQILALLLPG